MNTPISNLTKRIVIILIVLIFLVLLGMASTIPLQGSQVHSEVYTKVSLSQEIGGYFNAVFSLPLMGLAVLLVINSVATMIILKRRGPTKTLQRLKLAASLAAVTSPIAAVFSCVLFNGILRDAPAPDMFMIWAPIFFTGMIIIGVVGNTTVEGIAVILENTKDLRRFAIYSISGAILFFAGISAIVYAYAMISSSNHYGYTPTISGLVLDGDTGNPIPGAMVKVEWLGILNGRKMTYFTKTYQVGRDGRYQIPGRSRKLERLPGLNHETPGKLMLVYSAPDRRPEYSSRPVFEEPWTDKSGINIMYLYAFGSEPKKIPSSGRTLNDINARPHVPK